MTRLVGAELLKLRTTRTFWALAGEYRHGTIASTLLVTPQRLRAVSAAVVACLLGGLAIGLAIGGLAAALGAAWRRRSGRSTRCCSRPSPQ